MPLNHATRMLAGLSLALMLPGVASRADDPVAATASDNTVWQRYDWLSASSPWQAAAGTTVTVHAGQELKDPHAVITHGALWQENVDAVCTQRLADPLALSYGTRSISSEAPDSAPSDAAPNDQFRQQTVGLQFQPASALTLHLNLHDAMTAPALSGPSTYANGAGFALESKVPVNVVLPFNPELTLDLNSDRTATDLSPATTTTSTACNAQFKQPLGSLPLTAVLKGHYEEIGSAGSAPGRTPSLEQSLVWKPIQDATLQMGLRQQQYQEYPGINNQFNQALFADWSQNLAGDFSWHSYAEVLNSRGLIDQAPAAPLASGTNGTAQATNPATANTSLTSTLPLSFDDQTLTFSTGPSFHLQKDLSASLEYSNRWDKNPAPGSIGQEQRVSLSLKGTF